jgi:transposase
MPINSLSFPKTLELISIGETGLFNGELYTIITNKADKGRKGYLIAIIEGTASEKVIEVIEQIPDEIRTQVEEVKLGMAESMRKIIRRCFPKAIRIIDHFHVQKLAMDSLQEMHINYRGEAINKKTSAKENAKLSSY